MGKESLRLVTLVFCLLALVAGESSAREASSPIAVSPGDPVNATLVEARCPTFSWGAVAGAVSHELVVYEIEGGAPSSEPVLSQVLPGPVYSWTPPLGRCPRRGADYAWAIRPLFEGESGEWSVPNLFRIVEAASLGLVPTPEDRLPANRHSEYEGASREPRHLTASVPPTVRADGDGDKAVAGSVGEAVEAPSAGLSLRSDGIVFPDAAVVQEAAPMWAVVEDASGGITVVRAGNAVSVDKLGDGRYLVEFPRSTAGCAGVAVPGWSEPKLNGDDVYGCPFTCSSLVKTGVDVGILRVLRRGVEVKIRSAYDSGPYVNSGFNLVLICGAP